LVKCGGDEYRGPVPPALKFLTSKRAAEKICLRKNGLASSVVVATILEVTKSEIKRQEQCR
jgi:hypothetical protein